MTNAPSNQELVEDVLAEAVAIGVGSVDARPREGQLALARDIATVMSPVGNDDAAGSGKGHLAGLAGVGIGKSFAALSNAGMRSAKYGERTLYSTKSLSLQAQIVDKDAPVVSKAAEKVLGKPFTTAVLKGWANYACMNKAYDTGMALIGEVPSSFPGKGSIAPLIAKLKRLPDIGKKQMDGFEFDLATMKPLVLWALNQGLRDETSGDKDTYDGAVTEVNWAGVSVSTDECVGVSVCPFAEMCKSDRARNRAAEADVVVTNHSLLAVQAAIGVPVVLGNSTLGVFDHIIVDEAHELPKVVRSQGEAGVSGRRMTQLVRLVKSIADEREQPVAQWVEDGYHVGELVQQELHRMFRDTSTGDIGRLTEKDDPLENTGDAIVAWARIASRLIKKPIGQATVAGNMKQIIAGKRAQAGIDSLIADVNTVRTEKKGVARWLQAPPLAAPGQQRKKSQSWYIAQSAQVEVGGALRSNLWTQTIEDPETHEEVDVSPSVSCISGTLPKNFVSEAGLTSKQVIAYKLPFAEAYDESMLFIPSAKNPDAVAALTDPNPYGGKRKFNVAKHHEWALDVMKELIDANRGHALVLSATSGGAKKYAAALEAHAGGRFRVYTQWDASSPRITIARWKEDPTGVLVGTQGLMTGVDAPGETNSLVILDRVPRAAGNPVDDARAALIADRMGGDKAAEWTARRLVYVSDACELLGQSRGRLVRGQNDRGMFAMLDPRLLKNHPFSYEESSRNDMMDAINAFGQKTTDLSKAVEFLAGRQDMRDAA
ncbi:ATP-dependent DNA helicase [Leifsonia sp. Leaf264]|uniref:ATP-dependent DNA helicase n=1 Tax=Leifsonia sp. Leaf264 TaxID=1736314 RepID=UPI0006F8E952|nr:helicase C-terminal domain-containing protein [Leifsonia sp. Leaf264]KQO98756.1 hypothetical protein ASF30_11890 [Leifsonia sp. Leaf264]